MITSITKLVLRFADSSHWPGQFVALDSASGGYPYAVEDPTRAEFWATEEAALSYASSFTPKLYSMYAIEPKAHKMKVEVEG